MKSFRPACVGALRLARVCVHLLAGCATLLLLYPACGQAMRLRLKRRWSARLLRLLGIELEVQGMPHGSGAGVLRVANHVSWLDIFVINAALPGAFVAKQEVRTWPVIGWLCRRTETIFLRREVRRDAHAAARQMTVRLAQGQDVTLFPEGTTSDGHAVLPFSSALLQAAIDAATDIQPLALRYATPDGRRSDSPVYVGTTSLLESLWRTATASGLRVRLALLPARGAEAGARRTLAALLRADIQAALPAETLTHVPPAPDDLVATACPAATERQYSCS